MTYEKNIEYYRMKEILSTSSNIIMALQTINIEAIYFNQLNLIFMLFIHIQAILFVDENKIFF